MSSDTLNDAIRSASSHSAMSRYELGSDCQYTVSSNDVYALLIPPTAITRFMCSSGATCADPRHIMCSNMCANPCLSPRSSFDPTWYNTLTCTTGAVFNGA